MSFLTIEDVTYSYQGKNPVLHQVNWEIKKGEFHCLLGKSGCGKTTLLKLAAGLLQSDKGSIRLQGSEVVSLLRNVDLCFNLLIFWNGKRSSIMFCFRLSL